MSASGMGVQPARVTEWCAAIVSAAQNGVRVISCEDWIVVDFLGQLRFRLCPADQRLTVCYRSPTGFWLDAPDSLSLNAAHPLQWCWTRYWLAHRRAELAQHNLSGDARQFAALCDAYADAVLRQLSPSFKRRLRQQLGLALTGQQPVTKKKRSQKSTPSSRQPVPKVFQSFRELLASVAQDNALVL